jgi:hypothetical protein
MLEINSNKTLNDLVRIQVKNYEFHFQNNNLNSLDIKLEQDADNGTNIFEKKLEFPLELVGTF